MQRGQAKETSCWKNVLPRDVGSRDASVQQMAPFASRTVIATANVVAIAFVWENSCSVVAVFQQATTAAWRLKRQVQGFEVAVRSEAALYSSEQAVDKSQAGWYLSPRLSNPS